MTQQLIDRLIKDARHQKMGGTTIAYWSQGVPRTRRQMAEDLEELIQLWERK